jgi:phosphoribosylaminoimidazolecarboxamide formyltransferase / IMP cyclohydrolase
MVRRALISVYDKTGLDEFAAGLVELGVELVGSGGTAAYISELGLPVTPVDELTDVPELLGGRVKTLHPRIHAAILARRDSHQDMAMLAEQGIEPFDLVCVNLYPFAQVAGRKDVREEDAVEMIDIGGPAMLRAAAKNFVHVAPVCSLARYGPVLEELRLDGDLSAETRRELATEAFSHTAAYEASIASWFSDRETFPPRLILSLEKERDLPYGENPHQRAAYYPEAGVRRHLLSRVEQLSGKELSFNNLSDLDAARGVVREFELPTCVIVKHANPCGVGIASDLEEAYAKAHASDPVSAYGGVVAVNRRIDPPLAVRLADQFLEVLIAPEYTADAVEILKQKPGTRILEDRERRRASSGERDYRRVLGGLLVQDADAEVDDRDTMEVVAGQAPTEAGWGDLLFAWRVCKHVLSNAIVIAKDLQTIGIGAGQMSRVDAVRIALEKARQHGHSLQGAALASDAFFPFPDGPELAFEAGVRAIVQPGGSKRDEEVIGAAEKVDATMVFTRRRHFRH